MEIKSPMAIDAGEVASSLERFISERMEALNRDGVILGLSGGIDSAVAAALCVKAVGKEKTLALIMPDRDSGKGHIRDALDWAENLGVAARVIDITPFLKKLGVYKLFFLHRLPIPKRLKESLARKAHAYYERKRGMTPFSAALAGIRDEEFDSYLKRSTAYYRVKHRLRMLLLYLHAELENRLVVGAANRTEYMIGFFVKHGIDHAADVMPLLNLYKTQVRQLARYLGVPSGIIEKAPSPDIVPGITDELAIGMAYEKLDPILHAINEGRDLKQIALELKIKESELLRVKELNKRSSHMRSLYVP